jgi:hypothetical protein
MLSRRHVLKAGLASLALPEALRLQAASSTANDAAVIFVLQEGGASQFETWDPKPDADSAIRGEFQPIRTAVPGTHFSELMVEQARIADKMTILRSIHHPSTQHSSSVHLMKTGYYCRPDATVNEMPAAGSIAAKLCGPVRPQVPPYALLYVGERYDGPLYLGSAYSPFTVKNDEDKPKLQPPRVSLIDGLTGEALHDRTRLLSDFERTRKVLDAKGEAAALSEYQRQAVDLVTGPAARRALDLDAEPTKVRDQYGRNYQGERFLLARRLIEHGSRFVTVGTHDWDQHGELWKTMRKRVPAFDRGLASLIADLHDRGLDRRVLVVVVGEFGRTPVISTLPGSTPGRDHWGDVMSVALAGGGFPGGQVIGSSDAKGAVPRSSPYRLECVLALMYRHLGIDPALTFPDHSGRPRNILEIRDRIKELEG